MSLVKGASSKKNHYKTCNILSANFTCLLFLHMVRAERGLSNGPPFVGRGLEQQKHYKTCVFLNVCFTHVWFLHTVLNERGLELHSDNCLRPPWSARLLTGLQRKGSRASSEQFLDDAFLKDLGIGPQRKGYRANYVCFYLFLLYFIFC